VEAIRSEAPSSSHIAPGLAADRDDRIESAHLRHLQIHQRDVRTIQTKLLDGLTPIPGFGDKLYVV
jgi:hypothetical protein